MYRAELASVIDRPWLGMKPIVVGQRPAGSETPEAYVLIEHDGMPLARVDAYITHSGPFTQLIAWNRFILLGWNGAVHVIDPAAQDAHSIHCDGYFGSFYRLDDRILVTTASQVICIGDAGCVLWRQPDVGIDGVLIKAVKGGIISGQAEWDPPGGWRPFRLRLATGQPLPTDQSQ